MKISELFKDFPPITTAEWEAKILADLKGADYEKKLIWKTAEGIDIKPFYRSEDLNDLDYLESLADLIAPGSDRTDWLICQNIAWTGDASEVKQKIDNALSGGANAVTIVISGKIQPGKEDLDSITDLFVRENVELRFSGSENCEQLWRNLSQILSEKSQSIKNLSGSMGFDPLGRLVLKGKVDNGDFIFKSLSGVLEEGAKLAPGLRILEINAGYFQNAGSTLVQELGYALSVAVEYIDRLTDLGNDPAHVTGAMQFNFAIGSNYFMEIAKLRAARILWQKICNAYGVPGEKQYMPVHATSAEWNLTLYDPYVNMLRATTESMSAILGGADSLTVLPYDYPFGQTSEFSERIARNTQNILKREAYFNKVIDPAAGSYYIENLTDAMVREAWHLFKTVEEEGGYAKAYLSGYIKESIESAKAERKKRISQRRESILGTNQFPNFSEMIIDQLNENVYEGESRDEINANVLKPFRAAAPFEKIRLETERSGKRPKVYMLKYGNPAWMTARAMFSGNFFACAGYEIIDPPGVKTIDEGIRLAKKAKADVVVICSSDDQYPEIAPKIYQALNKQAEIVIAGYPKDSIEQLKASGIKHFIHMKINILDALQEFNNLLLK